ncbi:hypothetical protein Hanom_Chr17g01523861 [Helianthus anomalus]
MDFEDPNDGQGTLHYHNQCRPPRTAKRFDKKARYYRKVMACLPDRQQHTRQQLYTEDNSRQQYQ